MSAKIIAVSNQKGGVGKTQTAISLGVGLAKHGKKVMIADLDPQGSCTISLGFKDFYEVTISEILQCMIDGAELPSKESYLLHTEGVDLIPCDIRLAGIETRLLNSLSRENKLKFFLSELREDYDYILLDCPPALSMLTLNALVAADSVLIPVQAENLATMGLVELLKTISMINKQINPTLTIEGILITLYDKRLKEANVTVESILTAYSEHIKIFDTYIPKSTRVSEATRIGKSIFESDPNGKVTIAYENIVKELIENE